jgi:hypothetical protein
MIPIETIPGMGEGGIKETSGRVNSSMIHLRHCKNFCKCHNIPPSSTTIKRSQEVFMYISNIIVKNYINFNLHILPVSK